MHDDLDAGGAVDDHGAYLHVLGEPARHGLVDLLAGACTAVGEVAVLGGGVAGALRRGRGERVADVEHQPHLQDAEEERDEHDQHQHEVHDRGPLLAACPTSAHHDGRCRG